MLSLNENFTLHNTKKALIVANLAGFVGFLSNDIKILQSKGYHVFYAANSGGNKKDKITSDLKEKNITYCDIGFASKNPFSFRNIKAFFQLCKLLKNEKFDLIHCHTPIVGLIVRLAAQKYRRKGIKVIYTSHGFTFTKYSSKKKTLFYFGLEKFVSKYTDAIITINNEDFENAKKMKCEKVYIINGVGVDTDFYHNVDIDVNEYKTYLSLPLDKKVILSVGELSERKNHQIIIKAISKLESKKDYIYVICGKEVGGNQFARYLKELAKEYDVDLYLLGHRKDIPQIMHCSDIGAIPSVREGLGLAGIQSLCAEVPLVGTDVQGIKEYVIEGVTGYLCEPYDENSFADLILKLSDENLRNKLKANCFEVAKRFDKSISNRQMEDIYNEILC